MKAFALLLLFPFAALALPEPVFAQQTTYTYTGAPLTPTLVVMGGNAPQPPTGPQQITGTVTLAAPLAPNQANQIVTPVSYQFDNDIILTSTWISTAQPTPPPAVFSFTTVNGTIVAWNVSVTKHGDINNAAS